MQALQVRRVATLYDCQGEFEVEGPHSAAVWEPLNVNVPLSARPLCCYGSTVIFYRDANGTDELARCTTLDLSQPSPTLVFFGSRWWEIGSGRVVQHDGRWCMRWQLGANTRMARELNHGMQVERRNQLATVN